MATVRRAVALCGLFASLSLSTAFIRPAGKGPYSSLTRTFQNILLQAADSYFIRSLSLNLPHT